MHCQEMRITLGLPNLQLRIPLHPKRTAGAFCESSCHLACFFSDLIPLLEKNIAVPLRVHQGLSQWVSNGYSPDKHSPVVQRRYRMKRFICHLFVVTLFIATNKAPK